MLITVETNRIALASACAAASAGGDLVLVGRNGTRLNEVECEIHTERAAALKGLEQ